MNTLVECAEPIVLSAYMSGHTRGKSRIKLVAGTNGRKFWPLIFFRWKDFSVRVFSVYTPIPVRNDTLVSIIVFQSDQTQIRK